MFLTKLKLIHPSSRPSRRTFIHSKQQLELTKVIKIQADQCKNSQPIAVFIHTAAKYFDRRTALRNTWVSHVKRLNISVYFVLGVTNDKTTQEKIETESNLFRDLIQIDFIDNYHNNTLKAISILRWIHRFCKNPEFILKTDDDVVLDINKIVKNLNKLERGLTGDLMVNAWVSREPGHKWYIPVQYYPNSTYPPYMNGPAYIMSNDIVADLLHTTEEYSGYILDIDDMFITGIIAELAQIRRYDFDSLVEGNGCTDACALYSTAITYECKTSEELINFYTDWKSGLISPDYCLMKGKTKIFLILIAVTIGSVVLIIALNIFLKKYKHAYLFNK